MSVPLVFLTVDPVLAIHQRMVQSYGGSDELCDRGRLEMAITEAIPQRSLGGADLHPTLSAKAAAYLFWICRFKPFNDGSRRTGLATSLMFLLLNGHRLQATKSEMEQLTRDAAAAQIGLREVIAFFEQHVVVDENAD